MRMMVSLMLSVSLLLLQGCWSHQTGCSEWRRSGETEVCCDRCLPGYRIFKRCSETTEDLCTPCTGGWFTDPITRRCARCKQCAGILVHLESCTNTKDTVCGCPPGLRCRTRDCVSCVDECKIGEQPNGSDVSCSDCPEGTFNDKIHEECKPWTTMCRKPGEFVVKADRFSVTCSSNATTTSSTTSTSSTTMRTFPKAEDSALPWWLVIAVSSTLLFPLMLMIKIIKKLKEKKIKLKELAKKPAKKPLTITTPTDDPTTLIAVECSFHEPEQENSSESLSTESEGSAHKLIV